jgi:hypothetical protein
VAKRKRRRRRGAAAEPELTPAQDVAAWLDESPLDHLELMVLLARIMPELTFREYCTGYLLHEHAAARHAGDIERVNALHLLAND